MNRYTVIIPARAGSKRLPGKNTMDFCGKTLIEWAIEVADAIPNSAWITSDIEKTTSLTSHYKHYGFIPRPPELAQDDTPTIEVLKHAVSYIHGRTGIMPEHIILLQPTSPLRTVEDMKGCIELYERYEGERPVYSKSEKPDGWYGPNGAVYIYPVSLLLTDWDWNDEDELGYLMPPERSIDIDTQADWDEAERLMRERLEAE